MYKYPAMLTSTWNTEKQYYTITISKIQGLNYFLNIIILCCTRISNVKSHNDKNENVRPNLKGTFKHFHQLWTIKSRKIRWVIRVARSETTNIFRILVGNPEGKKLLRRPSYGWKDDNKTDFKQTGSEGMDWMKLYQWRTIVSTLINLRVP
jgi:hypothetical protein